MAEEFYVKLANSDTPQRRQMLRGMTKTQLLQICKFFRLNATGNTICLTNRIATSRLTTR